MKDLLLKFTIAVFIAVSALSFCTAHVAARSTLTQTSWKFSVRLGDADFYLGFIVSLHSDLLSMRRRGGDTHIEFDWYHASLRHPRSLFGTLGLSLRF